MLLGEIIRTYRNEHGLSAEQFATTAKLSRVYVSNIENNYNPKTKKEIIPTSNVLKKVAKAMGLSLDELTNKLDDDQLINVVQKVNVSYERTTDIDKRFDYFLEELIERDDTFTINNMEMTDKDVKILHTLVKKCLCTAREIIKINHK